MVVWLACWVWLREAFSDKLGDEELSVSMDTFQQNFEALVSFVCLIFECSGVVCGPVWCLAGSTVSHRSEVLFMEVFLAPFRDHLGSHNRFSSIICLTHFGG